MELSRGAIAGIIAVVVIFIGGIGFMWYQSNSTTLSTSAEKQHQQTIEQQYQQSMQAGQGPTIYDKERREEPVQTSTSGGGGQPDIYK